MVLAPIVLLLGIGLGLLYVRLLNGPISLAFLKEPIEQSISSEFPDFTVHIGQPVVVLREHSFEFRLTDVRLTDKSGKSVAFAPLAAVELSQRALLTGRISPSQIVLIEPQIRMFYTPGDGLSLTIDTARRRRQVPSSTSIPGQILPRIELQTAPQEVSSPPAFATSTGRIDLAQTVTSLAQRARSQGNATSFLDRIGFRNATMIVDHDGVRRALRVPTANFNLAHSDLRSVLSGNIAVASRHGTWRVGLRVEDAHDKNQVRLTAVVQDLYPQAIADAVPKLKALDQFRFPISAKADFVLSSQGQVLAGVFDVSLGAGEIQVPQLAERRATLNSGRVRLFYRRGQDQISIETATLNWAQSSITLNGLLKQRIVGSAVSAWDFQLQATDGRFATTGDGAFVKLERLNVNGTLLPTQGIVNLDQFMVETDDGSLVMDGVIYTGSTPGYSINGRFGPMAVQNILAYWPNYLAVKARAWTAKNIMAGQLRGGTFDMRLRTPAQSGAETTTDYAVTVKADLADVRLSVDDKLPPIYAPQAEISFKDNDFNVRIPQSAFAQAEDSTMLISDLNFDIKNIFSPDLDGQATFKVNGELDKSIEIIHKLDIGDTTALSKLHESFSGKVSGNFQVIVPLERAAGIAPSAQLTGLVRIVDGRAKGVWQALGIEGSNIIIDITDDNVLARGEMLVRGVPVTIGWRKGLGNEAQTASPLTLRAILDDADRNSLGLNINHIIKGPVEINATMTGLYEQQVTGIPLAHVRIDVTKAALQVESLALEKPIGRKTFLDFDIEGDRNDGWRLTNLRIDGDTMAAKGSAQINPQGKLAAFDISDFAIDVVTRLKIKGERREDNIWRVSVRGKSFEGRDFFRAMFSPGNSQDSTDVTSDPGLDLDVQIDNVLGYWDTTLRDLRLYLSKRNGKITALSAYGKFQDNNNLRATVRRQNDVRQLVVTSNDAGQTFKLVGFYPNVRSGDLQSIIDLESTKSGGRRGLLAVRRFNVLGDQIVSEVLNTRRQARQKDADAGREIIQFDWMRLPFVVGSGRFVMRDVELRGPLHGGVLCGKADFEKREMQVAGTYIPLQGLSSVIGVIPGIGNLLAGAKGEGIFGVNFEVRGNMQRPQVLVNPLSAVTPGILREVFKVACPDSKFVTAKSSDLKSPSIKPKIDQGWASETFPSEN